MPLVPVNQKAQRCFAGKALLNQELNSFHKSVGIERGAKTGLLSI
jgi:hypothetical protein